MLVAANMRSWWRLKTPQERALVIVLALLAAGAAFWLAIWEPLTRDLARLEAERIRLARELAQARRDVEESVRLSRSPAPAASEARSALEASLAHAGLRAATTSLEWRERNAYVTFATVRFNDLVNWLERTHREDGFYVREATLSALEQPGSVRADLVLAR